MVDIVMKRDPVTGRERPQERDFNDRKRVVRVLPKNDDIRRYLKHGITKVGFLAEGSSEWPNDQFTRNRIREGVVTIEEAATAPESEQPVIEPSGAKSGERLRTSARTPSETSSTVDPNKTTAPKT